MLPVAEIAAALTQRLAEGDILYAVADDVRAIALTRALSIAAPEAEVLFCPGSDALPGEAAPASPANVGQRVAALHRLYRRTRAGETRPVACITTGEALAQAYPEPAAFSAAPPVV